MPFEIDKGLEADLAEVLGLNDQEAEKDETTPEDDEKAQQDQEQEGEPEDASQDDEDEKAQESNVLEIDGEQVTLDQIRAWKKGHLMEQDYTRKTQEVARERRELEQLRAQLQPLMQLEQMLRANPVLQQQLANQVQQWRQQGLVPASVGFDSPMVQQLTALEQQIADLQLERELAQLRATMSATRAEMGLKPLSKAEEEALEVQIMQQALDSGHDLLTAFKASDARDSWLKQALASKSKASEAAQGQRKASQPTAKVLQGAPRGNGRAPSVSRPAPKTIDQATALAAKDLLASGMSLFTLDE